MIKDTKPQRTDLSRSPNPVEAEWHGKVLPFFDRVTRCMIAIAAALTLLLIWVLQ